MVIFLPFPTPPPLLSFLDVTLKYDSFNTYLELLKFAGSLAPSCRMVEGHNMEDKCRNVTSCWLTIEKF